jgi:hypothetical protein
MIYVITSFLRYLVEDADQTDRPIDIKQLWFRISEC